MMKTMTPATTARPAAIGRLTVKTKRDRRERRHARRQDVPDEHVLAGEHRV